MKKVLAALFAAALAFSLCNGVFADSNVALNATFEAPTKADGSQPLVNINDGDRDSFWESVDPNSPAVTVTASWSAAQNINKLTFVWGGGKPAVDGTAGTWAGYSSIEYSVDGTTWNTLPVSVERTTSELPYIDEVTWTGGAITATKIRVNLAQFQMNGAYQMYEFEAYGSAAQGGGDNNQGGANTGVASTLGFAVVAMAAAAVALKSKKNAD